MPGRPFVLAETNWKNVKEIPYELAILPWGATEAHNYHLPYSTDTIESTHIAHEAARIAWEQGARVIVLPTIPFGVNTSQLDIRLTINMNMSTQLALLDDIAGSLARQRIPKLLVLNGHGGNDFKQIIRELVPKHEIFLCTMNWYRCLDNAQFFEDTGDHAGEMETSLVQFLEPELVLPLSEAGEGAARQFRVAAFREGWAWTPRDWLRATRDTGVGNPYAANAEKGCRFFEAVTQQIAEFLVELANADVKDLYS